MRKKSLLSFLLIATTLFVGCGAKDADSIDTAYSSYKEMDEAKNTSLIEESQYYNEVSYEGENVPYYLFSIPFQKTDSMYVSNKDLSVSDERYSLYKSKLESKINSMFNVSYNDILADQDKWIETFTLNTANEDDSLGYDLLEWYVDNKATTIAEISTGKCMVYKDATFYVLRASVNLKIYGDKNCAKELYKKLGINANNETVTLITEMYFNPDNAGSIAGFTLTNIE